MKTKRTLRKLAEPFSYVLMVAAFGFITTLANQADRDLVNQAEGDIVNQAEGDLASQSEGVQYSGDSELLTLILEDSFETVFLKEQTELDL